MVSPKDPLDDVFAFREVTLAEPAACAHCRVELAPGASAHLGITDSPALPRPLLCEVCAPRV